MPASNSSPFSNFQIKGVLKENAYTDSERTVPAPGCSLGNMCITKINASCRQTLQLM